MVWHKEICLWQYFILIVFGFGYKEIMILSPGQVFSLSNIPSSMNGGVGVGVGV